MSWNAPNNWTEVLQSVLSGWDFHAKGLGIRGAETFSVLGNQATRGVLSGHLDDFAHSIIESHNAIHTRYVNGANRDDAVWPESYVYVVIRDGNAVVAVTRSGDVVVNPAVDRSTRRYREVVGRVVPVLESAVKDWPWCK